MKYISCKVCKSKYCALGFCKLHYGMLSRKLIDVNGIPKEGYFLDAKFHIKKIKSTLRQTIIESDWYRKWRSDEIKRANKSCEVCGIKNVRLNVHHHVKKNFEIMRDARAFSNIVSEQLAFCQKEHTYGLSKVLCLKCHAEEHKNDKVYGWLSKISKGDKCRVCGGGCYCKNFCMKHYGRFRAGIYDEGGVQIRPIRGEVKKVKIEPIKKEKRTCLVCGSCYYGLGFCLTHYNRFRIGQIDVAGKELRALKDPHQSNVILIEFNGEIHSISGWARKIGMSSKALAKRLRRWTKEKALTEPVNINFRRSPK